MGYYGRKRRISKAILRCGWLIEWPTVGTNYRYRVTSKVPPDTVKLFDHLGEAERWCERHDVLDADFALAMAGR